MNPVHYLNNSSWRVKVTALCWFFGSLIGIFAYLTRFFAFESVANLTAYAACGAFVLPVFLISCFPLLKVIWKFVALPVLNLPPWLLTKFGLDPDTVMGMDKNGNPTKKMYFGEWLSFLFVSLVFCFYYIGGLVAILVATGVASGALLCWTLLVLTGISLLFSASIVGDSHQL